VSLPLDTLSLHVPAPSGYIPDNHQHDELMDEIMVRVAEQEEGLGFEDHM
jgi:hypothetical protein